jgi:hypothetical protein
MALSAEAYAIRLVIKEVLAIPRSSWLSPRSHGMWGTQFFFYEAILFAEFAGIGCELLQYSSNVRTAFP